MKNVIALILVVAGSHAAYANTQTCSNSNQTLTYTHRSSAPQDITTIKYEEFSQHRFNTNDAPIDFQLSQIDVKQQDPSGPATLKTTTALAQGSVTTDGKRVSFREWVVCKELQPNIAEK